MCMSKEGSCRGLHSKTKQAVEIMIIQSVDYRPPNEKDLVGRPPSCWRNLKET